MKQFEGKKKDKFSLEICEQRRNSLNINKITYTVSYKYCLKKLLIWIFAYFRAYFIFKTNINKPGAGVATAKEKEMTCRLIL